MIGIIVGVIITISVEYGFGVIKQNNSPYLSTKEQLKVLFITNKDLFEEVVLLAAQEEQDILLQYNSSLGREQIDKLLNKKELSDVIWNLISYCGMTNFQKDHNFFLIYQYAPIPESDIYIGVRYNYQTLNWEYYYQHDYNRCRHSNTFFYRLFDCVYNRNTILE